MLMKQHYSFCAPERNLLSRSASRRGPTMRSGLWQSAMLTRQGNFWTPSGGRLSPASRLSTRSWMPGAKLPPAAPEARDVCLRRLPRADRFLIWISQMRPFIAPSPHERQTPGSWLPTCQLSRASPGSWRLWVGPTMFTFGRPTSPRSGCGSSPVGTEMCSSTRSSTGLPTLAAPGSAAISCLATSIWTFTSARPSWVDR
mmetsp:Transcript_20371/g.44382  ORF Transcript_20371/g.44382 Transcript_20371/m.44382 type:complete len:200 (+) Transcript_20371:791-1390(+)